MGYKSSRYNFEENHLQWCKMDFWKSLEGNELFEKYGQAKLDCLLAGMRYREEIGMADFNESEKEFHELLELAERTQRVSETIDRILVEAINW